MMGRRAAVADTLVALYPGLASEWESTRNGDLRPEQTSPWSRKKVWWRCRAGHEWEAVIASRTGGRGCPYCAGRLATPERNLAVLHPEVAAEWHPTRNGDLRPDQLRPGSDKRVWWRCPAGHEWDAAVRSRSRGTGCPSCAGTFATPDYNLAALHPEVAAQWHPTRNGDLRPEQLTPSSKKKVWWRCLAGHDWEALIAWRTRGTGCPYCARRLASPERNLAVLHPEVAAQWHPTRNGDLWSEQLTPSTKKKVWWRCAAGHEWEAAISARTRGTGCPYCAGRLATPERNLAVDYPELAAQWHPTRNGDLRPDQLRPGSTKTVWWRCPAGHEWQTAIRNRARTRTGCPSCVPESNLAIVHPDVAAEWHPIRNGDLRPEQVAPSSDKKVWWRCLAGHEWQAMVQSRSRWKGCPYCAGRRATPERNFAVVYPTLTTQWHPTRNADLRPEQVTPSSDKRVWWRCPAGHEWEAVVRSRSRGTGCPYCTGTRASPERNLAVVFPAIAAQWHPTRNGDLRPDQLRPRSTKKVWWRCPAGHEWEAVVNNRVSRPSSCPYCAKRRPTP